MENLTNFDTLIYIYLAMTVGTLIYPIDLWLRVNFVNFIFMVLFVISMILLQVDISKLNNLIILRDDFQTLMSSIGAIVFAWVVLLRITNNISLLDSLFLGILPYTVLYVAMFTSLDDNRVITEYLYAVIFYVVPYAALTYKKMILTIPFAVKGMSDRY